MQYNGADSAVYGDMERDKYSALFFEQSGQKDASPFRISVFRDVRRQQLEFGICGFNIGGVASGCAILIYAETVYQRTYGGSGQRLG